MPKNIKKYSTDINTLKEHIEEPERNLNIERKISQLLMNHLEPFQDDYTDNFSNLHMKLKQIVINSE